MIERIPGSAATRSKAVIHDGLVYTVSTAKTKSPSMHAQTVEALAALDQNLADAGTSKSRLLRVTVYITDMARKAEMNAAWDDWVDRANPPQRACIGVVLEGEDLIEILAIAAV